MNYPAENNNFLSNHVDRLICSYRMLLNEDLIPPLQNPVHLAKALFYAPFVVVSHNTEVDPIFNYANLKALELFGFTWEEFTQLPSRLSAEPNHQRERESLLAEVCRNGFLASYEGIRIAKNGRQFLIKKAVVWNLEDQNGSFAGQAARFDDWQFL